MEMEFPKGFTLGLQHELFSPMGGGRLPLYFGCNDHNAVVVIVRTVHHRHFWGYLSLRVPHPKIDFWKFRPDELGRMLLNGNNLDERAIWRRFEARECDPLLFVCLAKEWLSELPNDPPPPPANTAQGVPYCATSVMADCGYDTCLVDTYSPASLAALKSSTHK
jgi:hypothetical protein